MDNYSVRYSARFDAGLAEIEQAYVKWGKAQTLKYIGEVVRRCERLAYFPKRFEAVSINGQPYRSFTHKAHRVFYQVNDDTKTVSVVAILRGSMDFRERLSDFC